MFFTAAFIVSRIDKREMKDDMVKMNNQTRAEMKEMQIEMQTNNRLTLFIAVIAIVIPIL